MAKPANDIREAINVLKRGGVVVFPTETAYGLAADATNTKAVAKIYQIKGREAGKSLPLIASDQKMAERYVRLSPAMKKLAKIHWPGPLTIVSPPNKGKSGGGLARRVVRDGTIAIRVADHAIARALAKGLGEPITATSANLSGQPTCYSARAVHKQGVVADFVIDIGALPRRKPSTIVAEKEGEIVVLRKGPIRL